MHPTPPTTTTAPHRLADLWWLLTHNFDHRGKMVVGADHFAIGLAACALGEAFTQEAGLLDREGNVATDPVVTHVIDQIVGAKRELQAVQPPRVWVEWLAANEVHELERVVVVRMVATGWLQTNGQQMWPKDPMTAFAPVTMLMTAVGGKGHFGSDSVRLLAGITAACGLAPRIAMTGDDVLFPLQSLARELPKPLYTLVVAVDDAIHAVASRLR